MLLKRLMPLLLALSLILIFAPASAGTYYVYTANGKTLNLRSPADNSVIGHIPYGTKLETDDNLSTETAAYVTYKGVSGYVKWEFLVKDPPKPRNSGASQTASQPVPPAQTGEGAITVQVIGGTVGYASGGGSYSEISYDIPQKLTVTASKKPAYWVINGVRYDFEPHIPSSFTLDNCWESMTIEAVMKKQASATLLSPQDIQNARTGDRLIVQTIHAKLCHLNAKDYGAGGWITDFDFTDDYMNRATKKQELGGQVTIRVKATIPNGKKISYWLFDEAKIDFNTNVTQFIVRTLNTSKTYEPVFGGSNPSPTREPSAITTRPSATQAPSAVNTRPSATREPSSITTRPSVTQEPSSITTRPSATREPTSITTRPSATQAPESSSTRPVSNTRPPASETSTYLVNCTGCSFSYNGRSGLTNTRVAEGTKLTVSVSSRGAVEAWYVNGARRVLNRNGDPDTSTSITVTINRDTTIKCVMK